MQLEVQWFVAALASEGLMSLEDSKQVYQGIDPECDLSSFAQAALDAASGNLGDQEAESLLESFEQIAEYALEQAETGEAPPDGYRIDTDTAQADKAKEADGDFVEFSASGGEQTPVSTLPPKTLAAPLGLPKPSIATPTANKPTPAGLPSTPSSQLPKGAPKGLPQPGLSGPGLSPKLAGATPAPTAAPAAASKPKTAPAPEPEPGNAHGGEGEPGLSAGFKATDIIPSDYAIRTAIEQAYPREVNESWLGILPFENVSAMSDEEVINFMLNLLREVRKRGASDLHISSLGYPFVRRNSVNETISSHIVTPDEAFRLNTLLLDTEQFDMFNKAKDLNYALQIDMSNRFRVSLMMHKDGAAGAYRLVPERLMTLEDLGFNPKNIATIEQFLDYHNGLILVTGPIGSGKTTTLAAMVNIINNKRHDHVITVEDPIEIVQKSLNCNVTQREIKAHTSSYRAALKGALREDPDVIIIGELHDLETIEMAITASETGHLVIGTLHTCDAANTLNRLLDVFPPTQQPQIRAMTAGSLRGIVCQRLLPTVDSSMTVAVELLVNTMAVGNIISDGRTHHLRAVLQTGQNAGMVTMDASILDLYMRGKISRETAEYNIRSSDVKQEFKRVVATEEARKLSKN